MSINPWHWLGFLVVMMGCWLQWGCIDGLTHEDQASQCEEIMAYHWGVCGLKFNVYTQDEVAEACEWREPISSFNSNLWLCWLECYEHEPWCEGYEECLVECFGDPGSWLEE